MKLILDAGHYVNTPGKRTPDDIREWTLNNRVAVAFQNEIAKYDVQVIRTDDPSGQNDVTLNQRDAIGKQGDVLLSIHHNAFKGVWGDHGGTETLIQAGKEKDRAYATAMNNSVVNTLGLRNRGIKAGNTQILRNFGTGVSCLVEVGFMDSNTDKVIRDPQASIRVGTNLAIDFAKHFGLKLRTGAPVQPNTSNESIEGSSVVSAAQLAAFAKTNNADFDSNIAEAFISVGNVYGIKGDIAFCQSILETGWFKYAGSAVKASQHNYCGLGATSNGVSGASFNSIRDGVAAQMQHLMAYANTKDIPSGEALLDPRFHLVTRGVAPTWTGLNGRWATGANYGQKILAIYDQLIAHSGASPVAPVKPTPTPTPVPSTKYKVGDTVNFTQLSTQSNNGTIVKSSINSGKITKIFSGATHPYLINDGSGFLNDSMVGSNAGSKAPVSNKPKVGDTVSFSQLSTQSVGGSVVKSSINSGKITKIFAGATYPYLINNGSGFVNDAMIGGAVVAPSRPQVGDTVHFTQLSTQANGGRVVTSSIKSGKITKIFAGTSHPYLINGGSGFVNDKMIGR